MNKKADELTWIEWWKKEKLAEKERWKQNHPNEPEWLRYASRQCQERYRKKKELEERKLFEMRKQLFNAEKGKSITVSSKNEPGLKSLRQKFNPDLPNPSLKKLIAHCWQNIQDWKKEQQIRERELVSRESEILTKKKNE